MTREYTTLFIDLDDTLWDIDHNAKECLREIYLEHRYNRFYPTFEHYYNVYKPNNVALWNRYHEGKIKKSELIVERFLIPLRPFGIDDENYAKQLSDDFLQRSTLKTKLVDGAIELLEYLKPNYRMHILSNGFREVQYKKIENSGLKPYFDKIILSENAGVNKPHPDMFTHALKSTNARRQQSIMIGDNFDTDIVGAWRSGIDQIWFNPQQKNATRCQPTHTVSSLIEIKKIL